MVLMHILVQTQLVIVTQQIDYTTELIPVITIDENHRLLLVQESLNP